MALNSRSYWDDEVVESFMLDYSMTTSFEISWVNYLVSTHEEDAARRAACMILEARQKKHHEARELFERMRVRCKIEEDQFHYNTTDGGWEDYLQWRLESCRNYAAADRALVADLWTCHLEELIELLRVRCEECRSQTEEIISELNSLHNRKKRLQNMRYGIV